MTNITDHSQRRMRPPVIIIVEIAFHGSFFKSFLAAEAVCEFIEVNEWQIEEIGKAVKEADAGDFASDQEVWAVFNKWGVSGD